MTRPPSRPNTPTKPTRSPSSASPRPTRSTSSRSATSPVDHTVTALLTAAVMEVIGGVVNAGLREDQIPVVAGLPGIVATTTDPWPAVYGTAVFLRAWTEQPSFRLLR
ncbi:DUF6368 family protein [Streptomyces sp. NBC_01478]|uniref:DUF6368 family protein n=1 Tax=Streptomyces sp. NBC_01478 TaxID=2903882 RepID=UPI002E32E2F7|nr:DUF6368 family protein [Streptomyces sp. NBC_01478]